MEYLSKSDTCKPPRQMCKRGGGRVLKVELSIFGAELYFIEGNA